MEFDEAKKRFWEITGNKKFQIIATVALFAVILIWSSSIRLSNMPLLVDQTTGKNIPLALDPFYFLRISETILEQGKLPEVDVMRAQFLNGGFTREILPQTVVFIYNFANIFGDFSIQYINVISPVIFFILGLIIFFFLVYFLTNSKLTALLSSGFLAFVPAYLYRTMAGFSDHEAIGMMAFFAVLLLYVFSLRYFDKKRALWIMTCILALGTAFLTAFTIASWAGIANFVFMIIPLSFLLFWIFKTNEVDSKALKKYLLFYIVWFVFSFIFGLFFGFEFSSLIGRFVLSSNGLISVFILGFIIIDYFLIRNQNKFLFLEKRRKYRVLISAGLTIILGILLLLFLGKNIFSLISEIWTRLLHPFGAGRVGLTVAENKQPYLLDWISQTGKILFWLFFSGLIVLGLKFSKGILRNKNKIWFVFFWVLMISGVLFSRISSGHLLNGENFISQVFYMGGLLIFTIYFIWVYLNDQIRIDSNLLILFSWMFFILISGRGAIRLFFVVTPFICLSAGFFVVEVFNYFKKSKGEIMKIILICILILSIVGSAYSLFMFYGSIQVQAKNTGPSAGYQWQNVGAWIRENTPENSIFIHWWDYGYWIQYLGERPTVTDGGHATGAFGDHMIGRYVLTTPKPETALSFMKSTNVSYLLIDPTDLGKYGAYSKIGSDDTGEDRYSWIPVMIIDPQQTRETSSGKILVYSGGGIVDEDIVYTVSKEDKIKILNHKQEYNEFGNLIVTGIAENVAGEKLSYAEIRIKFYDKNDILIDTFLDNISDFNPGEKWNFKVLYPGLDTEKVNRHEIGKVTPEGETTQIFLPAWKAAFAGIVLETTKSENEMSFNQPEGVFFYNGRQIRIPLRYVYYEGKILDFGAGLDAVIYIIPKVYQSNQGLQIDNLGALIYLSPKVSKSLFVQLYLLNDVFDNYKTMTLAHAEPSLVVESLNNQGLNLNEFIYYQGFRGPIKIWKTGYPPNLIAREEFVRETGDYAEFDDLEFIK